MELNKYKLVVFRCSFTFGLVHPDCLDVNEKGPEPLPAKWLGQTICKHLENFIH